MPRTLFVISLSSLSYLTQSGATPLSIPNTNSLQPGQSFINPRADAAEILPSSILPGESCKRINTCVDPENPQAVSCERNGYEGFRTVGWDRAGCGKDLGKPICCPHDSGVTSCTWRSGKGGDCNAQCEAGEVALVGSSWGGGWHIDGNTNKCSRGRKAFCCEVPEYERLFEGCLMSDCGKSCADGMDSLFETKCGLTSTSHYCCPSNTNAFTDCLWRGGSSGSDCANPVCHANEISLGRYKYDKNGDFCAWGRKKSACCSLTDPFSPEPSASFAPIDAPPPAPTQNPEPTDSPSESSGSSDSAQCSDVNLCDHPGWCSDEYGNLPDEVVGRRDLTDTETDSYSNIVKRGRYGPPGNIYDLITGAFLFAISARHITTAPAGMLFTTFRGPAVLRGRFETQSSECSDLTVGLTPIQLSDKGKYRQIEGQPMAGTEHVVDPSYIKRLIEHARLGILPSQGPARVGAIPDSYWQGVWQRMVLPGDLPRIGSQGISPRIPFERAYQALGTQENRDNLLLTSGSINGPKGQAFRGDPPITRDNLFADITAARQSGQGESLFLEYIRQGMAIIPYMNLEDVSSRVVNVHRLFQQQLEYIAQFTAQEDGADRLVPFNTDFRVSYYLATQDLLQNWAKDMIQAARADFNAHPMGQNYAVVMETLDRLEEEMKNMVFNFLDDLD